MSTNTELDRFNAPVAAPSPRFLGQATAVEQSRAVAEVHAAIVVAQQCPRNTVAALEEMRRVCAMKGMADRAFYAFPRGGTTVTGPTIHLARELARIWGNIQYGISELRRDDEGHYSEMQAVAWDLQTNARSSQVFVVPHKRDAKKGHAPEVLIDLRDIYEMSANQGARRLRSAIWAVLPTWLTDEAVEICRVTLRGDTSGVPLPQRIQNMLGKFSKELGVSSEQIEHRLEKPIGRWDERDLSQLGITYGSIQRGELSVDDAFPSRVTRDDVAPAAVRKPRPVKAVETHGVQVEDPPGDYDPTTEPGWQGGAQ